MLQILLLLLSVNTKIIDSYGHCCNDSCINMPQTFYNMKFPPVLCVRSHENLPEQHLSLFLWNRHMRPWFLSRQLFRKHTPTHFVILLLIAGIERNPGPINESLQSNRTAASFDNSNEYFLTDHSYCSPETRSFAGDHTAFITESTTHARENHLPTVHNSLESSSTELFSEESSSPAKRLHADNYETNTKLVTNIKANVIFIPRMVIAEFIKNANENYAEDGRIETLALLIGYRDGCNVHATELLFPTQNGGPSRVSDQGSFGMDTFIWIAHHSETVKRYGSRTTLVTWIHSHVRGFEVGFSSIDMHTQYSLHTMYPEVVGHVVEIREDGTFRDDYFVLTQCGMEAVRHCSSMYNLSSEQHSGCSNRDYFRSYRYSIELTDGNVVVQQSRFGCPGCRKYMCKSSTLMRHLSQKPTCKEAYGIETYTLQLKRFRKIRKTKAWKDGHNALINLEHPQVPTSETLGDDHDMDEQHTNFP